MPISQPLSEAATYPDKAIQRGEETQTRLCFAGFDGPFCSKAKIKKIALATVEPVSLFSAFQVRRGPSAKPRK